MFLCTSQTYQLLNACHKVPVDIMQVPVKVVYTLRCMPYIIVSPKLKYLWNVHKSHVMMFTDPASSYHLEALKCTETYETPNFGNLDT